VSLIAIDALKRVKYFRSLSAAELAGLARRCCQRALKRGEHAFEAGDACRGLLVVAEGAVEMRQVSPRGREQVLHAEGAGAARRYDLGHRLCVPLSAYCLY